MIANLTSKRKIGKNLKLTTFIDHVPNSLPHSIIDFN